MQQVHSVKSVAQAGNPVDVEVYTHIYCGIINIIAIHGVSIFVDFKVTNYP